MHSGHLRIVLLSLGTVLPILMGSDGGCSPLPTPPDSQDITTAAIAGAVESIAEEAGTLKVLITDKPFPFEFIDQAWVTITRVEVRRAEDPTAEAGGDPFIVFDQEEGRSFNLVELRNGRVDTLVGAGLPPGRYTQVRIVVTQGEVRLHDGRTFTLRVPSGEEAGIKLNCDFEVGSGEETGLLLDVDLSRAFSPVPGGTIIEPGQIREFRFSPSAAMRLVRLGEAGSLSGTVRDINGFPIPAVAVTALTEGVEVTSAATSENGAFTLIGLPAGTYTIEFSADGYRETRLDAVSVAADQTTELGIVTLQPSAPAKALSSSLQAAGPAAGIQEVNYALNAQVTLHGTFFTTTYHAGPASDPQTITDGIFLPRRTTWDQGTVWWVWLYGFNSGHYIDLDLGRACRVESFVVQTYSKEAFVLSYLDPNDQTWKPAWNVPKGDVYAIGMETRPDPRDNTARYVLPNPIVTSRLRFTGAATSGVHLYSVSEIQAFGRPLDAPPVADAGGPYLAGATSWNGAAVMLNGGGSSDPDGDELQYSWWIGDQEIGATPTLSWFFPIGETKVSLTVADPAGATSTAQALVTVTKTQVAVDIKPGDEINSINLTSRGGLPVAFLTDATFDAATIDPATVSFPGHDFSGFVRMKGKDHKTPQASLEDVDGDGDLDLVVHLETAALPLEGDETTCTLGALTWDGHLVVGSDHVRIVGSSGASTPMDGK